MAILRTRIDSGGEAFRQNRQAYETHRAAVAAAREKSLAAGGEKAIALHHSRGKLTARERVSRLLDPGTPFLEIGQLAGHEVYDDPVASAGMVAGLGMVTGRLVSIVANDATVKGGTYYPLTVKKHIRAQQIARENKLASVYLVDSGGAFLPLQDDLFPDEHHFGSIFRSIAEMSAMGLPQVAAVMGQCTAGGAYIPAMSDETVIVRDTGTIYLGGPQLVQAATGEVVDAQRLGGAEVHTRHSAVADHHAIDDQHCLMLVREILSRRPASAPPAPPQRPEPPLYDPAELVGIVPANPREPIPAREVLARILDGSRLLEYRERWGQSIVCGTGAINGWPVGVLVNDGVLFSESAQKAANFIEICSQRDIPLLFLHNISGFMVGEEYEAGGIARHGAKMVNAVSCSRVPKFSVLIGGSYGAGNFAMCGRAFGPRLMAMWPNARTSVMGGEQAATVLTLVREAQLAKQGRAMTAGEAEAFKAPIREAYETRSHPVHAAARLWVDAVIDPADTRPWLTLGLASAAASPSQETRFGVFRM
ncbi:MAG: methylcrotonoyl-CoA carboxylase [Hyphomicrobiaceae bacterium]|nr:methylcrotonoyl-CoA carboxylase [Hyphomicrobiaceae bacterium]